MKGIKFNDVLRKRGQIPFRAGYFPLGVDVGEGRDFFKGLGTLFVQVEGSVVAKAVYSGPPHDGVGCGARHGGRVEGGSYGDEGYSSVVAVQIGRGGSLFQVHPHSRVGEVSLTQVVKGFFHPAVGKV